MNRYLLVLLTLMLAWSAAAEDTPASEFDWGFVASRLTDVNGDVRFRAMGPFFEHAVSTNDLDLLAVRPLYSRAVNPETEWTNRDILWPVGSSKNLKEDYSWRVLLVYYWNNDTSDPQSARCLWVLPVLFFGRTDEGQRYGALFPVGGSIHNILFKDQVHFVLFPLYAYSSVGPVETRSVLWPIYSRTKGKGIYRFRIFPIYGQSKHRDHWKKRFVLWPIWNSAEFYKPGDGGSAFILFPLFGRVAVDDLRTTWVIPPLFRHSKSDRGRLVYCPWPFFQYASGEVDKLYLWPLWGHKEMPGQKSSFVLWPFLGAREFERDDLLFSRRQFAPFVYSERLHQKSAEPDAGAKGNHFKLWPLFSVSRLDEDSVFRGLELWPFRRNPDPVERSWAPIWTLWRRARSGEDTDTEVLWGLYRSERRGPEYKRLSLFPLVSWERDRRAEADARSWALLKGLVGYDREGSTKSWRLLYFMRFGGKEPQP